MKIAIGIGVVVIGLAIIWIFLPSDFTLPYGDLYEFRVTPTGSEGQYIRDYLLRYDFEKNTGLLSFRYWHANQVNPEISIVLPLEVEIQNYSVKSYNDKEDLTNRIECFSNNNTRNNYLNCFLKGNFNEALLFEVNLSSLGNFYPNGLFIVGNHFDEATAVSRYETADRNVLLEFNFGNLYRCLEPCFVKEIGNDKLGYYLGNNLFTVYVFPGSESEDIKFSRFRLNTYDYRSSRFNQLILAFGISLLAGSLLFILESIPFLKLKKYWRNLLKEKNFLRVLMKLNPSTGH